MSEKEQPSRFKIGPAGTAQLFLQAHAKGAGPGAKDALVELLFFYYQQGFQEGKKKGGDAE